jgi:hypothetical protein
MLEAGQVLDRKRKLIESLNQWTDWKHPRFISGHRNSSGISTISPWKLRIAYNTNSHKSVQCGFHQPRDILKSAETDHELLSTASND